METSIFTPEDIIFSYTRAMALEEGLQVACPEDLSKEAGFTIPLFFTRRAWDKYVKVPIGQEGFQDLTGRLWDVLTMLNHYSKKNRNESTLLFKLIVSMNDAGDWEPNEKMYEQSRTMRLVTLCCECSPIDPDNMKPCLTISIPGED